MYGVPWTYVLDPHLAFCSDPLDVALKLGLEVLLVVEEVVVEVVSKMNLYPICPTWHLLLETWLQYSVQTSVTFLPTAGI